jgi:hypothetical protein
MHYCIAIVIERVHVRVPTPFMPIFPLCLLHTNQPNHPTISIPIPRTRSYKKDDEPQPLLNWIGAMSRCSREKVLLSRVHRRGI